MTQPLSYIHPDAKIAENVVIEPFSVIHSNVEIGEGTWIGSNVTIFGGARIGKNCKIYPGACISAIPQDLKFIGEDTLAIIGDNSTIRECVTMNRGTVEKFKTEIGKNCLIMAYCHIAHDCIIGDNVILANAVQLAGHIEIGNFVNIGGLSAVQQFTKIGNQAFIGGGSMVKKDVPPFVMATGDPVRYSRVNSVGLKRRGYSPEQINHILDIYHIVYMGKLNVSDAAKRIEIEIEDRNHEKLKF
jgi:UDP-N-acetylglucosamine acyltransferase